MFGMERTHFSMLSDSDLGMPRHNVNLRLTANKGSVTQLNFADVHMLKSAY